MVNADPQPKKAPTGALLDTCFRQIEFAGILKGTAHEKAAKQLVDFMLSEPFQEDMPLQMFVFPVPRGHEAAAGVHEVRRGRPEPLTLPPEEIARNRDQWIEQWTDTVLR